MVKDAKSIVGTLLECRTEVKFQWKGNWVPMSRRWEVMAYFPATKKVSLREILEDGHEGLIALKQRPPRHVMVMTLDQAQREFHEILTADQEARKVEMVDGFRNYDQAREEFLRDYGKNRSLHNLIMPRTVKPTGELNIVWPGELVNTQNQSEK